MSNDVSCQQMILGRSGESAQAIGRFRESRIAVTTCLWNRERTSRVAAVGRGVDTAAEASGGDVELR